jgi:chromosomal replication initiation ATPase DnaA
LSGKTHLTHIFSENISLHTNSSYPAPRISAEKIEQNMPPLLFEKNHCLIVEDLNEHIDEEAFFHLYNLYGNEGGSILFTSQTPPARLNFKLPDLQSRLNIVPAIEIHEPDDELLSALIVKLFMDRQITVSIEVINYILKNMERSFTYAHKLIGEIDNISIVYKKAVSIPIVKDAILSLNNNAQGELF